VTTTNLDQEIPRECPSTPVVIAAISRPLGSTGVHTHIRQVQRYLASRGVPCRLVTPFSVDRLLSTPVFGTRLVLRPFSTEASVGWYRHWHFSFLRRALRARLSEMGETVIYAQCPLSARAALEARQGPEQRVVMAVHFQVSQADEWVVKGEIKRNGRAFRAIRQMESEVLPRLDGIVYLSRSTQENLSTWLHDLDAVPSRQIHNFVFDTPASAPTAPVADLVTVGGLEEFKNQRFILEVLGAASRMGRDYTLDVIGTGPCRRSLELRARELGLAGQVRFLGYRPDAQSLLPGYRAYVHASRSESFSLVIVEAMAAGIPVFAGAVGGIPELFDPTREGRFWPLDDPTESARILIELLDDEDARTRTGLAARARFTRTFSASVLGPELLTFLMSNRRPLPTNRAPRAADTRIGGAA
jgi:glycosyltransferase involved in cell wall biosynthesis